MQKTVVRNPNQSPIRRNLLNIAGIVVQGETIAPQNGDRLLGGYGVAWLNNQDAASQTTGQDNPLPECNCESGGGGGENDYPFTPCSACATLAESVEIFAAGNEPCCIEDGKDCSTGTAVPICLSEKCGGGYGQECTPPPPNVCTTAVIHFSWTGGEEYKLTTLQKVADDINSGVDENFSKAVQNVGGGDVQNERTESSTRTVRCGDNVYELAYNTARRGFVVGKGWANSTASFINYPSQTYYQKGLENWEKPQGKYLKNGKFYDACGLEPQDCITVCDENGVSYEICTDMNGKPKIEKKGI